MTDYRGQMTDYKAAKIREANERAAEKALHPRIKILRQYSHQADMIKRILRKHGRLHMNRFDEIFDRPFKPRRYFPLIPGAYILGRKDEGEWGCWIDLLKLLNGAGEVQTEGDLPDVYYSLRED